MFANNQLIYLGHILSAEGVKADPSKITAMVEWPIPEDLKALRGLLGLMGHYHRFVHNYGKIAAPLTTLLKKDAFKWGDEAQNAFEELKKAMTTLLVLAMPDFTQSFELETDASSTGIGVVLMQKGQPIGYFSHALSLKFQFKSIYERELMAIALAIKQWHHYLLGHKFVIKTNQRALNYLLE